MCKEISLTQGELNMSLARGSRQYLGVRALHPPDLQYALRDPASTDISYVKGTLWLNTLDNTSFMYSGTSGVWIPLGSSQSTGFMVGSGTATLVAGTVTIPNTSIQAGDIVSITRNALNASPALGSLIYTISAGVSIGVTSYSAVGAAATTDVSGFTYTIFRPS